MLALNVTLDPRIRIGIALVWVVVFGGMAVAMWRKRPFSQRALPFLLTAYTLIELVQLIFFAQNVSLQQILMTGVFYLMLIIVLWWGLKRPSAQAYFSKKKSNTRSVL
ncbi:MAG: hypothetical protein DWQ04_21740 [Chloroflexi bacterium]|nr:MAG: hypothetical protein DWQ04_21740 [Chloroflexota bacterium]